MAKPARVVEPDVLQPRALRQDFEQLVDLLLVFDDGKADIGVLEHERHFGRHGVLVERHRHAAQGLRRHHGPVQARPVVADDGQAVAALESPCSEAAGENANLARDLSPGPGLPDAQVLLPERRPVGPYPRLVQQKARKSVRLFRHGVLLGRAPPQNIANSANRRILQHHFGPIFNYTLRSLSCLGNPLHADGLRAE